MNTTLTRIVALLLCTHSYAQAEDTRPTLSVAALTALLDAQQWARAGNLIASGPRLRDGYGRWTMVPLDNGREAQSTRLLGCVDTIETFFYDREHCGSEPRYRLACLKKAQPKESGTPVVNFTEQACGFRYEPYETAATDTATEIARLSVQIDEEQARADEARARQEAAEQRAKASPRFKRAELAGGLCRIQTELPLVTAEQKRQDRLNAASGTVDLRARRELSAVRLALDDEARTLRAQYVAAKGTPVRDWCAHEGPDEVLRTFVEAELRREATK